MIGTLLQRWKTHVTDEASLGLTAETVLIRTVDPSLVRSRRMLFITPLTIPSRYIDDDVKRCTIEMVTTFAMQLDQTRRDNDLAQLLEAYEPLHAHMEGLMPAGLNGAKKVTDADEGWQMLGLDTGQGIVAAMCGWEIEYERKRGTTGDA